MTDQMQSVQLSRLEFEHILAHVDDDIDEEVLTKLRIGAAKRKGGTAYVPVPEVRQQYKTPIPEGSSEDGRRGDEDDSKAAPYEVLTLETAPKGWTQEDVDRVNHERAITHMAAERLSKGINFGAIMQPEKPPGYGIERVPLNGRNAAGDTCIQVDGNGVSTFRCKLGHTYRGDNPAQKTCSICYIEGQSSAGESDEGGIDNRW